MDAQMYSLFVVDVQRVGNYVDNRQPLRKTETGLSILVIQPEQPRELDEVALKLTAVMLADAQED